MNEIVSEEINFPVILQKKHFLSDQKDIIDRFLAISKFTNVPYLMFAANSALWGTSGIYINQLDLAGFFSLEIVGT
jgi:hypothetical protein